MCGIRIGSTRYFFGLDTLGSDSAIAHTEPQPGDLRHGRADASKAVSVPGYSPSASVKPGIEDPTGG